MHSFLYQFFHRETDDRTEKGLVSIPKDKESWPEAWKRIEFKRYSLLKEIPLPKIDKGVLEALLRKRRSSEGYILENKLNVASLSYILECGYGLQRTDEEKRKKHRNVPSAGQLYPLEVYLFLFRQCEGLEPGVYHYSVRNHTLEPVVKTSFTKEDIHQFVPNSEWLQDTTGMICMTSVFHRTINKYGSRGYRYILLEAGHVAQNMLLAGTDNGVNLIPIGAVEAHPIEKKIGLSSEEEKLIYTLFF